ncbi:MAG: acyltransferase [Planctomycetes bacterium]|nr:acyltransferase [Planctomycetota bacterium]
MSPPGHAAQHDRIAALDGVRGLAVLAVMLLHCMNPMLAVGPLTAVDQFVVHLSCLGWAGVDLFFALSGFLITRILLESRDSPHYFRNFYARRSLRIFPLYYLVTVLLFFVLPRPPASNGQLTAHLLYYQNLSYGFGWTAYHDAAKGVTWSLAIEEQFYLVWPAVVFWCKRRWLPIVCALLFGLSLVMRCLLVDVVAASLLTPCRLDALALGAALAIMPAPPVALARACLVGAVTVVGIISVRYGPLVESDGMRTFGLSAIALLMAGLVAAALRGGLVARCCRIPPLRTLGKYSYAIYLLHILVTEQAITHLLGDHQHAGPLRRLLVPLGSNTVIVLCFFVIVVVATTAVAIVSWHLFEKHWLELKRHFPTGACQARSRP